MKTKKLKLKDLSIKSFTTTLHPEQIKGGDATLTVCGVDTLNCSQYDGCLTGGRGGCKITYVSPIC